MGRRRRYGTVGLQVLILVLSSVSRGVSVSSAAAVPTPSPAATPAPTAGILQEIREEEYKISRQGKSVVPGHPGGLHAANRAQDLRAYFEEDGVVVVRRTEAAPSWVLHLSLGEIETGGRKSKPGPVEPVATGRSVSYPRRELGETWENSEGGLNLRLRLPKGGTNDPVRVGFDASGGLAMLRSADGEEVSFYHEGERILRMRLIDADTVGSWKLDLGAQGPILQEQNENAGEGGAPPATERTVSMALLGASEPSLTGLSATPVWTAESNQTSSSFGWSVTGGDVNGDGYSDVIVGAPFFDNGKIAQGRVFLYLGSASGILSRAPWYPDGKQQNDQLGSSVTIAGDVNGDGYSDVIVGSPNFGNSQDNEGIAYLYLGSSSGLSPTPTWNSSDLSMTAGLGSVVSAAGDVNGDGYSDVVVGSPGFNVGGVNSGRIRVYLGSSSGLSTQPWTIDGTQMGTGFAGAVSAAGDVDGDGYSDVIVGAPTYTDNGIRCGRAYVYFGSASGFNSVWTVNGTQDGAEFGATVSSAGDVDGDGYSDVIVGAPSFTTIFNGEGKAFLILGSPSGPNNSDWNEEGDQAFSYFGFSAAAAGDVNGDGYADVLVGARQYSNGETEEGRAFLYLGSSSGLSPTPTWIAEGGQSLAFLGNAVSSAGDVNGDGYSDVIVGAPYFSSGQDREGVVFLYLGSASGPSEATPPLAAPVYQANAEFGLSAASAGDVNGDGCSDVVIGAPNYDNGLTNQGMAFLFLGSPTGLSLSAWSAEGSREYTHLGWSVSSAGDVNGDGYSDVIIGSFGGGDYITDNGKAFLFLGSPSGLLPQPAWTAEGAESSSLFSLDLGAAGDVNGDGYSDVIVGAPGRVGKAFLYLGEGSSTGLSQSSAWSVEGSQMDSGFASSVASAGDVNGDGYSDVVIGEPGYNDSQGRVLVYLGSPSGLSSAPAWIIMGSQTRSLFGGTVASAGDVNGDGFSDLIVAALEHSDVQFREGRISLYLGSSSGLSLTPAWVIEGHQENVRLVSAPSAGDVNGDGYSDVIVNAFEPYGSADRVGRTFLYLGSSSGLSSASAWRAQGTFDSGFGSVVATAGDVNGDSYSDFLIGEAGYQVVHEYFGNSGGKFRRSARQVRLGDGGPLALLGSSGASDVFRLKASVTPPKGGHVGHLEWEVRSVPGRSEQDEVTTGRGANQDLAGALAEFDETIDVPGPGYFRWRVRLHTDDPLEPNSPWFSMSGNGMTETKVRVGDPPSPAMAPIGPGPKDLIYMDTPPMPFSWHSGEGNDQFELEWSSNPEFRDTRVSAGMGAKPKGIGVYVPDPGTWLRILQMGRYPDPRQAPIFWKVSTNKNGVTSQAPTSGFWLAPVQGPRLLAPLDGETFLARDPPALAWDANHNLDTWDLTSHGGFEIWFATQRSLRNPLVLGSGYAIKAPSWPPVGGWTLSDWQRIVEMSCGTSDGKVYYAVFSQDAIGRRAWSQVQSLQIDREPTTCTGVPPSAQASHRQRGSGRKHAPGWKWHSH